MVWIYEHVVASYRTVQIWNGHSIPEKSNNSGLDGIETPTPADNTMQWFRPGWNPETPALAEIATQCFRPGWNRDSNASRECNSILQAWIERRLQPRRKMLQAWMECRLHRHQQTKQCFRLGGTETQTQKKKQGFRWNWDFNASSKQWLRPDWTETPMPADNAMQCIGPGWNEDSNPADKAMLQAWMECDSNPEDKAMLQTCLEQWLQPGRQSNASGLDWTETPTPEENTMQWFRARWNWYSNATR